MMGVEITKIFQKKKKKETLQSKSLTDSVFVLSHHDFQVFSLEPILNNVVCYNLFKKEGNIQINKCFCGYLHVFVGTLLGRQQESRNAWSFAWMETSIIMYIFLHTDNF